MQVDFIRGDARRCARVGLSFASLSEPNRRRSACESVTRPLGRRPHWRTNLPWNLGKLGEWPRSQPSCANKIWEKLVVSGGHMPFSPPSTVPSRCRGLPVGPIRSPARILDRQLKETPRRLWAETSTLLLQVFPHLTSWWPACHLSPSTQHEELADISSITHVLSFISSVSSHESWIRWLQTWQNKKTWMTRDCTWTLAF